jgi:Fe-S-cluster-containing dehydrogenase component
MEMGKDIIETPPGEDAKDLNDTAYVKLGILTTKLSDYLRKNGFSTEIAHPYGGLVNFSALGQEAGIGYIGESGLLISPELGPRQKISAIFTSISNLPLSEENEHDWIPYYCDKCGKCVKACPEKALIEKETCCGTEIELIQKNCIGCSQGCTYCIEACPFEEKGYEHVKNKFDKMNAKLREKQNKKFKAELWNNWTKQNSNMFDDLAKGSTMVIVMAENKEKLVFLEKGNDGFDISIKHLKELESSNADLLFVIDEKDMGEILKADDPSIFINLLTCGKIEVYGLMDHLQLMDKGYVAFLNKLGLSLGGGNCCG